MTTSPENILTADNTADLISVVRDAYPNLSKSDKKIADFLLEKPDQFIRASVKEGSAVTGVSDATVVRFGRNLGCDGFKDLKILLAQHLAIEQAHKDAASGKVLAPAGSFEEQIYHSALAVLDHAVKDIKPDIIDKAATIISQSKRVFVYGTGGSSGVLANEIHNRLFRLNITTTPFTDDYLQRMSASTLTSDDSILVISSTGRPRSLLESMEIAQHYGAKCVAITDKDSMLAAQADVCIHVELSQSGVLHNQPNPMRFAQLFIIDCLSHRVAQFLGNDAEETLQRVRASIASIHGIVAQQPIGD